MLKWEKLPPAVTWGYLEEAGDISGLSSCLYLSEVSFLELCTSVEAPYTIAENCQSIQAVERMPALV